MRFSLTINWPLLSKDKSFALKLLNMPVLIKRGLTVHGNVRWTA